MEVAEAGVTKPHHQVPRCEWGEEPAGGSWCPRPPGSLALDGSSAMLQTLLWGTLVFLCVCGVVFFFFLNCPIEFTLLRDTFELSCKFVEKWFLKLMPWSSVHTKVLYVSWEIMSLSSCRNFRKPRRAGGGNNAVGNPTLPR